ncbi:uncharacterized protein BX664DRAFT_325207 [Halteromyces radiatus]|uniref:uncharacterized protein n=1 Tax=Halteromyces radiatus TaxID=101107 RepID=UPI002220084B|nr:uncharacterized protein BX664DRAFT_325207 [Halteromyces radiatus]KAI8096927.1 hypothetical protein BX664DRAFT_325207 [Halteromyces radiatus]
MLRLSSSLLTSKKFLVSAGIHTTATRAAITRFNLPAMSPTMTEGTIHKWQKKEGESFAAGDVLLELETDKAQIDVEAPDDGVLAKIVLGDGQKGSVNSLIALLAEEGDDISNIQIPEDDSNTSSAQEQQTIKEEKKEANASVTPVVPMGHHDLDTSKLKKPLSPAVFSLVMRHHIKDVGQIKASGPGGRILKGDVLAHLGLIAPRPAPKPRHSVAPPRDQIEIAKPTAPVDDGKKSIQDKKEDTPVVPTYIERQVSMDALINLRSSLKEQSGTRVNLNDLISKAAGRALQEVNDGKVYNSNQSDKGIVSQTKSSVSTYSGGVFKIFHLAAPTYDFITDSYVGSKPYTLNVDKLQRIGKVKKETMVDIIDYLGGQQRSSSAVRTVSLNNIGSSDLFNQQQQGYYVNMKLEGGAPDQKAKLFLDRLEYYVRHPEDLIV